MAVCTQISYSLFHFKSNVLEYRAKWTQIVPLSKCLWTALYIFPELQLKCATYTEHYNWLLKVCWSVIIGRVVPRFCIDVPLSWIELLCLLLMGLIPVCLQIRSCTIRQSGRKASLYSCQLQRIQHSRLWRWRGRLPNPGESLSIYVSHGVTSCIFYHELVQHRGGNLSFNTIFHCTCPWVLTQQSTGVHMQLYAKHLGATGQKAFYN